MVLSNRKIKQKLRAEIAVSLTSSATTADGSDSANPNPVSNSQTQSLKLLLDSVTQKPRLSKREKKRRSGHDSETVNSKKGGGDVDVDVDENKNTGGVEEESKNFDVVGDENGGENVEKKKRKREEGEIGELGEGEGGFVKEAKKPNAKTNKKKKKQKQKKRKAKIGEEEDNNGGVGGGVVGNEEPNKGSESQVNNDYVSTKAYVGGIPYSSTENDIKRNFESCGTIDEIDCMTFPDSGRFRGIAIITFRTEGAAKRALALDGSEMDGLLLKIQPYKSTTRVVKTRDFAPGIVEGYNRIYIGNLSWDVTEEDLRKLFSDCKIDSIRFGMNKETGEFRGYAHVDFSNSLSLTMALKLDQEIVCGRPVKISCAVPKKGVKTESSSVPTESISVPTSNVVTSTDTDNAGSAAVSGKIRRRTCYECGEKGHLSSACPNKAANPTNSIAS
ncbi:hypothetical protein Ddye_028542 [Dipteronia dyeriana]|uniref:Uncharacterized protein n=1 Tax=Dipteronia dyeriana TaxID=168575 RepID=A0AAD9WKT1_9ROSI|nr:hypothetical protein Ddye_028542 [Dipteronia dyeriana]